MHYPSLAPSRKKVNMDVLPHIFNVKSEPKIFCLLDLIVGNSLAQVHPVKFSLTIKLKGMQDTLKALWN